jgi:hypothetical protein
MVIYMNNFCTKCGSPLAEGSMFCTQCGNPVGAQQPYPPTYYNAVKPKVPGRGFGISSMVLGIIGLFYSFVYFLGAVTLANFSEYYLKNGNDFLSGTISYDLMYSFNYDLTPGVGMVKEAYLVAVLFFAVLSVLALIFSINATKKGYKNGISKAGLITSIIGLCMYILSIILLMAS